MYIYERVINIVLTSPHEISKWEKIFYTREKFPAKHAYSKIKIKRIFWSPNESSSFHAFVAAKQFPVCVGQIFRFSNCLILTMVERARAHTPTHIDHSQKQCAQYYRNRVLGKIYCRENKKKKSRKLELSSC